MWLIGIVALMGVVGGIMALLCRRKLPTAPVIHWDLSRISESYALIVGPLAGFVITAAVFLANVTRAAQSPFFADVMGMLLIAFMVLVGTATMFSTFRSTQFQNPADPEFQVGHRVLYVLCNIEFSLGTGVAFLGIRPLLLAINLTAAARVFTWLLLFAIFAIGSRLGSWLHSLLGLRPIPSLLVPFLPIAAAAGYRILLVPAVPAFWPPTDPTLVFSVAVFVVGTPAFAIETASVAHLGSGKLTAVLGRMAHAVLPAYAAITMTALALLWLSVATE